MNVAELLATAELDPRVIDARERLARGEITKPRVRQIVHEVAGLCRACRRKPKNGFYCPRHKRGPNCSKPPTKAARDADHERRKQRRREPRELGHGIPLGQGGPGLPRTCKRCLQVGHFAKTCKAVIEERAA